MPGLNADHKLARPDAKVARVVHVRPV